MLTVYRASAGAGKTHTLTGEYLSLLFSTIPQVNKPLKHENSVAHLHQCTCEYSTRDSRAQNKQTTHSKLALS